MRTQEAPAEPPFGSKRAAALALYQPPFQYHHGYIFDSNGQMVSDSDSVPQHVAQRVRGWGRIGYMPNAAALQDEVGRVIAEALTAFWEGQPAKQEQGEPVAWPKGRDLFLRDDMGEGQLRVLFDGDNDVTVAIWPYDQPSVSLEFCNGFNGGGKSPETRKALIALMCAMERNGAQDRPHDGIKGAA